MGEQERTRVRLAGSAKAGMIELWNLSVLPALGLLAAAGLLGTAALRRVAPFLDLLEQIAYGVPVGMVVVSLGALLLASALELSTGLVAVIGLTSAIGASVLGSDAPVRVRLGLWQWRSSRSGARRSVSSLNAFHQQLQHVAKDSPTASPLATDDDYDLAPAAGLPRKHLVVPPASPPHNRRGKRSRGGSSWHCMFVR